MFVSPKLVDKIIFAKRIYVTPGMFGFFVKNSIL